MDGIQSAVDSLTSSSARLRALTVSTPSETIDVTVTGVTQGIADDVTVTGVTQGIADDETYGNPDDTYDDVDAEGLPAPHKIQWTQRRKRRSKYTAAVLLDLRFVTVLQN